MRCKRCGALLKKDGDLCTKCSAEIRKEQDMNADKNELLRIKKKYSPKYILTAKLVEVYIFYLLFIIFAIISKSYLTVFLITLVAIAIIFGVLVLSKKSASKTYIAFYDTKIVYKRKFLFIDKEKEMSYSDIKDIVFTQGTNWNDRMMQKHLKLGNIYVYPKKGNILIDGMQLEIVANIEKVMNDIKTVVGDKIK